MTEAMKITLSTQPADGRWGEKATWSINNDGIALHLNGKDDLGLIQRAARKIDGMGIKHVALSGEGWNTDRAWAFWAGYKGPKGQRQVEWPSLDDAQRSELDNRLTIIDWVRDTINAPAEELGPEQLAQRAVDLLCGVAGEKISYRITKGEDLREQGYLGLHTVGRGSERPPVLLALDYNPTGDKEAPVYACLVGKGITFDSGGYSIKQSAFMDSMKSDMGGAATITGALAFAITRGLNKRVKLYLCCADNLISGNAFKLGDIIHYRNGKTVEVMNTDAEGRLVLADGLIDASAQKPEGFVFRLSARQQAIRQRIVKAEQRVVIIAQRGFRRAGQGGGVDDQLWLLRRGVNQAIRQHRGGLPVPLRGKLPSGLAAYRLFGNLPQICR